MRAECTCPSKRWSRDCPIASHRWYAEKLERDKADAAARLAALQQGSAPRDMTD